MSTHVQSNVTSQETGLALPTWEAGRGAKSPLGASKRLGGVPITLRCAAQVRLFSATVSLHGPDRHSVCTGGHRRECLRILHTTEITRAGKAHILATGRKMYIWGGNKNRRTKTETRTKTTGYAHMYTNHPLAAQASTVETPIIIYTTSIVHTYIHIKTLH